MPETEVALGWKFYGITIPKFLPKNVEDKIPKNPKSPALVFLRAKSQNPKNPENLLQKLKRQR